MSCDGYEPTGHKFKTWQKILITAGIILFIFLAATCPSEGAILHSNYVIVQKGDSLSSIAKEVFGDYKQWPALQEMNGIKGTKINVGQKLFFANELSHTDQLVIANLSAYKYMKQWFQRRHGKRDYDLDNDSFEWAVAPIMGQRSPQLHYNIIETRRRAEWIDFVAVKMAIASHVQGEPEHVLIMTALAEQESGYRNLDGTHSEKGPFQIKPTTGLHYLKNEMPTDSLFYMTSWLEDIGNNTYASYQILKGLGLGKKPLRLIIERYNGGSKRKAYASGVLKRYEKIRKIYLKDTYEMQRRQ